MFKRLVLSSFLFFSVIYAQAVPPIPASVCVTPSDQDVQFNSDYWDGYAKGCAVAIPSPSKAVDYPSFRKSVDILLKSPYLFGWVNSYAVGYNAAIVDRANWVYLNDPVSPHNRIVVADFKLTPLAVYMSTR
jgi:hypothetical protein